MSGFDVILFADGNDELIERARLLSSHIVTYSWCKSVKIKCLNDMPGSSTDFNVADFSKRFKKGLGLWSWKPLIIQQAFSEIKLGDQLIYLDTGVEVVDSIFNPINNILGECDVAVYETSCLENLYTLPKVFEALNVVNKDQITKSNQLKATIIVLKKTQMTTELIDDWVRYSFLNDGYLLKDEGSACHRHDQSVFSVLLKKYLMEGLLSVKVRKEYFSLSERLLKNWYCNRNYSLIDAKNRKPNLKYRDSILWDFLSYFTLPLNFIIMLRRML